MGRPSVPFEQRWESMVDKTGDGGVYHGPDGTPCWIWQGGSPKSQKGYERIHRSKGQTVLAHRAIYEIVVGPIPKRMALDHLCENKPCTRPSHMEPVTHTENSRRYWKKNWFSWADSAMPSCRTPITDAA